VKEIEHIDPKLMEQARERFVKAIVTNTYQRINHQLQSISKAYGIPYVGVSNVTLVNELIKKGAITPYIKKAIEQERDEAMTNIESITKPITDEEIAPKISSLYKMRLDVKKPPPSSPGSSTQVLGHGEEGADGLWNHQIDDMMKKYPEYLGTIANDEIPKLIAIVKPKSQGCFIMNTDKHNEPGQHWVAVYFDGRDNGSKSIEYYDSFAEEPSETVMKDLKLLADKLNAGTYLKLKINKVIQQGDSSNCGYFAMHFLMDRLRGKTFPEASKWDDHIKGEKDIEAFKKQVGGEFGYVASFGGGIMDTVSEIWRRVKNFFSGKNEISPKIRNFLESQAGQQSIVQIDVNRAPIRAGVKKLLNILSRGKVEENQHKLNYDEIYHLSVSFLVGSKWYTFQKVPRWDMDEGRAIATAGVDMSQLQGRNIVVRSKVSLAELFMKAIEKYGEQKFFEYNAIHNNCQDGIVMLLGDLLTEDDKKFIKQDAPKIMEDTGTLAQLAATGITGIFHKIQGLFGMGHRPDIVSVLFDKSKWTVEKAEAWLHKHNMHPIKKVHETDRYLRYRLHEPDSGHQYRTKSVTNKGVKFVVAITK